MKNTTWHWVVGLLSALNALSALSALSSLSALSALSASGKGIAECKIPADELAALVNLIDDGAISGTQAKIVFAEMFSTGQNGAVQVSWVQGGGAWNGPLAISPLA